MRLFKTKIFGSSALIHQKHPLITFRSSFITLNSFTAPTFGNLVPLNILGPQIEKRW